jgi:hypothetical protein
MAKGIFGFLVGKTPKVPQLGTVSPEDVQAKTITGNAAALPGAEALASQANQFSQEELAKALNFFQPGALAQANKNIGAELRGELDPQDTQSLISSAVAAGYGKGFGGSFGNPGGIGGNLSLRSLGLGVEQQKQRGFADFLNLAQTTKTPQFDFSSMFYTPAQRLNFEENRAEQQFNRDWLQAQISAAPNPAGAFTTQLVLTLAGSAGKALGAAI